VCGGGRERWRTREVADARGGGRERWRTLTLGDAPSVLRAPCFECGVRPPALRPDGVSAPRGVSRVLLAASASLASANRGDSSTVAPARLVPTARPARHA